MIDYKRLEKSSIVQITMPTQLERNHILYVKQRLEEIQEVLEGYKGTGVRMF